MKALVYAQPGQMELQERPMPELVDGEVVLKIEAVGICGSDLHAWHGHDPRRQPGLVLGHEFVGRIERSAAPGFEPGSRWTGNPLIVCGTCEYCVQGRNNLCANRTMVGMTRPGAYAEYMSIPAPSLVALPPELPSVAAALTEPAATAWHAINLSMRALVRPLHECRVLVIGGGAIGMLAGLLLTHMGVRELTVTELNPMRIFSWALTEPVIIPAPMKRIARARRSHRFMHLLAFYSVTQGSRRAAQALFICQARLVPV